MSRKRWVTVDLPTFTERKHSSMKAAYEHVIKARNSYMDGSSRVTQVTVKVSEDKGPWQTFERCNFT